MNRHYAMKISQLEQEIEQSKSERRNVKEEQENSQSPSMKVSHSMCVSGVEQLYL